MKHLLSREGQRILEAFCIAPSLVGLDFDGTLAPIVREPEKAQIPKHREQLLAELMQAYPVAVISGRSLRDLRSRVRGDAKYLIGNHGAEGLPRRVLSEEDVTHVASRWRKQIESRLPRSLGVQLEDKGLSLALHYRNSSQRTMARSKILDLLPRLTPSPRVIFGKQVVNLIPAGAPHKGVALLELMLLEKTQSAIYVGDDDTDEDIFCLKDQHILTVRVGRKLQSMARYFIKSERELDDVFEVMIQLRRRFIHEARKKDSRGVSRKRVSRSLEA